MRAAPVILHLDLDAFFSAVEQLHKPSLRGKPVIVGGTGRRGVVATASYEARAFGVGSAMPVAQARRLCPNAAYLAPRFAAYRAASEVVMDLLREHSPLLEQVSVDEAYLDLTPSHPGADAAAVAAVAAGVRAAVRARTGLTASVGAGTSKLLAKIGSELAKPDGLHVTAAGQEAATLAPLPVGTLPWVGPATREVLRRRRVATVGDLAALPPDEVVALLGRAHGTTLHAYARGVDDRPVVTERETKSVSAEETFAVDVTDRADLDRHLRRLVERVTSRLTGEGHYARTVTLKLRRYDFTTLTRSTTLPQPTDAAATFLSAARALLAAIDVSDGVRLLGFGVSGLREWAQADLLEALAAPAGPDDAAADDAQPAPEPAATGRPAWVPGQDVRHADHGPGWVQGSGLGRVTVRFEGPHTGPGRILTFAVDDEALTPTDPPTW